MDAGERLLVVADDGVGVRDDDVGDRRDGHDGLVEWSRDCSCGWDGDWDGDWDWDGRSR